MGDGNLHRKLGSPGLARRQMHGKFQTGYHFDYPVDTHMSNLLVTMLDSVGVTIDKLGDSTGRLLLDHNHVA